MASEPIGDITVLLQAVRDGLPGAPDRLMALVYGELRNIARQRKASARADSLEPTSLVHEAYLRLFSRTDLSWENRHHFFWAAARAMRDILVERARRRGAAKRGGGCEHVPIMDDEAACISEATDLIALNQALERLEVLYPLAGQMVMLRFFAGLTREQVAEVTGMSSGAVWREWCLAKAWLHKELVGANSRSKAPHA